MRLYLVGGCVHSISAVRTATSFTRVAMVKVVMVILLLVHVTRHHWLPVSASPSDVTVARQQHHQLVGGASLAQADGGKRWAPTEIRMNEFIHKIRSRFHGESPTGFVRRAARRPTTAGQSESAARKILGRLGRRNDRTARKQTRAGVKHYRMRTRFGRIPSPLNAGDR